MKVILSLSFPVILLCCLLSCDKKGSTLSTKVKTDTVSASPLTVIVHYPDTDVYIGSYVDSQGQESYASYQNTATYTTPYTFYVIHLNDSLLVFVNAPNSVYTHCNDTTAKNDSNVYSFTVAPHVKTFNGPQLFSFTKDSLYFSFWTEEAICSEPPPTIFGFWGKLQSTH